MLQQLNTLYQFSDVASFLKRKVDTISLVGTNTDNIILTGSSTQKFRIISYKIVTTADTAMFLKGTTQAQSSMSSPTTARELSHISYVQGEYAFDLPLADDLIVRSSVNGVTAYYDILYVEVTS